MNGTAMEMDRYDGGAIKSPAMKYINEPQLSSQTYTEADDFILNMEVGDMLRRSIASAVSAANYGAWKVEYGDAGCYAAHGAMSMIGGSNNTEPIKSPLHGKTPISVAAHGNLSAGAKVGLEVAPVPPGLSSERKGVRVKDLLCVASPPGLVSEGDKEKAGSQQLTLNPGSIGHPEFCPRPCIYFAVGECSNGNQCEFCHLPHNKKPRRLGKRTRQHLESMSVSERLQVFSPILRQKAKVAGLSPKDIQELITGLTDELLAQEAATPLATQQSKLDARESKVLQSALSGSSFRTLVSMLYNLSGALESDEIAVAPNGVAMVLEKYRLEQRLS